MKVGNGIKILRILLGFLILSVIAFIFSMSLKNAQTSAKDSSRVLEFFNSLLRTLGVDLVLSHEFIRSLAHFLEFGLLSCLSYCFLITYSINPGLRFLLSLGFTSIIAVSDEILQLFSDGRAFQFTDILTDISGGFAGIVFAYLIYMIVSCVLKRKSKKELHNV